MIQVHHLEHSRSIRVLWLLEELGVDYEVVHYRRDPKTKEAPESLKKVHPLGKSPIITDGELTIAESGAIIEYLIDTYGQGRMRPQTGEALLEYRYWLHFAEGSLMPLLVMKMVLGMVEKAPMPFFIRPIARKIVAGIDQRFTLPRLKPQLALIEAHLQDRGWFAGHDLSGADIQMALSLQFCLSSLPDMSDYPQIRSYVERVERLPAYQRAGKKSE
ncbi:glutathione S-transferase family protein [Celerinatantimonas yamalensis]|uniref:Glutathione S-transferase n=1 Tax=Celerinatantimonas yamalensis TaxID=559956 RepID=A0ABW9G2G3_9GAMM